MFKKVIRFAKIPTRSQKQKMQRSLAELNNVRDVTFDQNQAIIQLYADLPDEVLVEHSEEAAEVPVVSLK